MKLRQAVVFGALLLAPVVAVRAQQEAPSPVLKAMQTELSRSMQVLKTQPVAPYFLSYEITDTRAVSVTGSFGTILNSSDTRRRNLDIDLRVGDYRLDNTRQIRGVYDPGSRYALVEVPLEDDAAALRAVLWYETDKKYKRAVEQLTKVKTNIQVKVQQEDKSADFSQEPAERYVEATPPISVDRKVWEDKLRRYTAPFAKYGDIYEATANFSLTGETRWYVNSEGTVLQTWQPYYRLSVSAYTKADDGMELPRYRSFFATTEKGLPDDAAVLKAVDKMIQELHALRSAPLVDPYTGPAILSGRASGVFFHEVFGHRVEGHRQKQEEDAQTFKKMLNQKLLPESVSVYFDPTQTRAGNTELSGSYRYDNQGVKAGRVTVIDKGVLKTFLMSRSPIEYFPNSNGHGRKQVGMAPVSRQSNLIVQPAQAVSRAQLKKMLIDLVQKENKPFGLWFEDITGGFTMTGRTIPNAFNVTPVLVYRVYADGREEMVRGVDLIGTPLTVFGRILAADDQVDVFNGICGAESGGVPVSAASPDILVAQIEVQKKGKSQERPPILPAPLERQ